MGLAILGFKSTQNYWFLSLGHDCIQAAYRGEHDPLTGVSGAIITGKPDTFGTSSVELRMTPSQREALSHGYREVEAGLGAFHGPAGLADRVVENGFGTRI